MIDDFAQLLATLISPPENAEAIVPSDTTDLAHATRGLYVGTTGDVKVTTVKGDVITFPSMAGGITHSIRVRRVWANGTAATGLVGVR